MTDRRRDRSAVEHGSLAALVSLAAVAALDAQMFLVAALCFVSSVFCFRRLGQNVADWLGPGHGGAGRTGQ